MTNQKLEKAALGIVQEKFWGDNVNLANCIAGKTLRITIVVPQMKNRRYQIFSEPDEWKLALDVIKSLNANIQAIQFINATCKKHNRKNCESCKTQEAEN